MLLIAKSLHEINASICQCTRILSSKFLNNKRQSNYKSYYTRPCNNTLRKMHHSYNSNYNFVMSTVSCVTNKCILTQKKTFSNSLVNQLGDGIGSKEKPTPEMVSIFYCYHYIIDFICQSIL